MRAEFIAVIVHGGYAHRTLFWKRISAGLVLKTGPVQCVAKAASSPPLSNFFFEHKGSMMPLLPHPGRMYSRYVPHTSRVFGLDIPDEGSQLHHRGPRSHSLVARGMHGKRLAYEVPLPQWPMPRMKLEVCFIAYTLSRTRSLARKSDASARLLPRYPAALREGFGDRLDAVPRRLMIFLLGQQSRAAPDVAEYGVQPIRRMPAHPEFQPFAACRDSAHSRLSLRLPASARGLASSGMVAHRGVNAS